MSLAPLLLSSHEGDYDTQLCWCLTAGLQTVYNKFCALPSLLSD